MVWRKVIILKNSRTMKREKIEVIKDILIAVITEKTSQCLSWENQGVEKQLC